MRIAATLVVLASFLSSITGISKEKLMTAEYVGGEHPKRRLYEKGKTSDIIVIIDTRNRIIVEVNQYPSIHLISANIVNFKYNIDKEIEI